MSTRNTQVGATVVMDVDNSGRVTQAGATVVMDVHNETRATQVGVTVVFVEQTALPFSYGQVA